MIAYFKKDKNSRMTFLYCTSIRENRKSLVKNQNPMVIESTLKVLIYSKLAVDDDELDA